MTGIHLREKRSASTLPIFDAPETSLHFIFLPQPLPGFESFIGAWLLRDRLRDRNFLIDCGPASSIPILLSTLRRMNVERIDYLLLTHVHLDHAGGAGHLAAEFSRMRICVAPRGKTHLLAPGRLLEGSLRTLGRTSEIYGRMLPIPEASLSGETAIENMKVLPTPGHASHHQSYLLSAGKRRILFCGEAAGVCFDTEEGLYLRPATPPRLFLDVFRRSLRRLIDTRFDLLCYAHCGFTAKSPELLQRHLEQLDLWEKTIDTMSKEGTPEESILEELLRDDKEMASFFTLADDIRKRERSFLRNSIRGFAGWAERS